jgi:hypothetical protein
MKNFFIFKCMLIFVLLTTVQAQADEDLNMARANYLAFTTKYCNADIENSPELAKLNKPQYCECSSNRLIESLSDLELKQALLQDGQPGPITEKQQEASIYCLEHNDKISQMIEDNFYQGCIGVESEPLSSDINQQAYCGCTAKKVSSNLSQEDIRDFMNIGSNSKVLVETNLSNKITKYVAECLNQQVK